jgi:hypothetical protein
MELSKKKKRSINMLFLFKCACHNSSIIGLYFGFDSPIDVFLFFFFLFFFGGWFLYEYHLSHFLCSIIYSTKSPTIIYQSDCV